MQLVKSAVWKRFAKSGLALEKLHERTTALFNAHRTYFDDVDPWPERFMALNNSIPKVKNLGLLSAEEEKKRTDIIYEIGDLSIESMADHEKLLTVHPVFFNEIYDATPVFQEITKYLEEHYEDEAACEPHLLRAEEIVKRLTGLTIEMEERLDKCKEGFKKQKELYYQVAE